MQIRPDFTPGPRAGGFEGRQDTVGEVGGKVGRYIEGGREAKGLGRLYRAPTETGKHGK